MKDGFQIKVIFDNIQGHMERGKRDCPSKVETVPRID